MSSDSDDGSEAFDFLDESADELPLKQLTDARTSEVVHDSPKKVASTEPPLDDVADGAVVPDWMIMLRRVFDAAHLSVACLDRFIECLVIMTFSEGDMIVRQVWEPRTWLEQTPSTPSD